MQVSPQYATTQERRSFFQELLDRIKPIHGVQAVGLVNFLPLSGSESVARFEVQGYANKKDQMVEARAITPDHLSAMQIPLIKGWGFTDGDGPGHPSVAMVNEAFVKNYFAGRDATGRHLRMNPTQPWITIVGVIGDVRNMSLEAAPPPHIYRRSGNLIQGVPTLQCARPFLGMLSSPGIRAAVRSLDPDLAISDIHSMSDLETAATARRRFQTICSRCSQQ